MQPSTIGVTVQGYNANTVIDAVYVHTDNNYTTTEKTKLAALNTAAQMPTGGTAGQILSKIDGTNYNTTWIDNYATQVKLQVKNATGSTINKGSVVYISGASGANALISLAQANSEMTSSSTIGLLESTLTTGSSGLVIVTGVISGVDTSAAVDGDPAYLSPTVAGGIVYGVANKPKAPNHLVYLGTVTRAHATVGEIQIRVANGYELDELHDVQITSPTANDFLVRNGSNLWVNQSPATARTSLGLGTAATTNSTAYATAAQGAKADTALQPSAIGTTVQAWDADLDIWSTKTAPSGTVVGTTDSQALTNKTIDFASNTLTGVASTSTSQTLTNKTLTNVVLSGSITEGVAALATSGTIALNATNATIQTCAAAGTITFTDSLTSGQSIVLMLTNGASYTINYPTITWVGPNGNAAPALSAANTLVF